MIRVVVADDQDLVREGLVLILGTAPDIEVVGEAADGVEAAAVARATRPDLVLMDVRMPRLDGLQATPHVLAAVPEVRVLVLTTFGVDADVVAALRAGASGYLLKDTPRPALLAAVRAVAAGEVLVDRDVLQALLPAAPRVTPDPRLERLTPRELEVLGGVARGLSNAEIAAELFLGESTVKTHVGRLLDKLGARDRVQLAVRAHSSGHASDA